MAGNPDDRFSCDTAHIILNFKRVSDYKLNWIRSSSLLSFMSSNSSGFSLSLSRDFLRLDFVFAPRLVSELTGKLSTEIYKHTRINFHQKHGLYMLIFNNGGCAILV